MQGNTDPQTSDTIHSKKLFFFLYESYILKKKMQISKFKIFL